MTAAAHSEAGWLSALTGTIRLIEHHTHAALRWKIGGGMALDDLGFDNLDRQSLACDLDEHFGIEISDQALIDWIFVADVARTVAELTARKTA